MATKDVTDRQVCEAYAEYQASLPKLSMDEIVHRISEGGPPIPESPYPYEILQRMTGHPERVCYRAMERAMDNDLVECGVSLRTGWLTDKGKTLLADSAPAR